MRIAAPVTMIVVHGPEGGHQNKADQDGEQFQHIVMLVVPLVDQDFEKCNVKKRTNRQAAEEHDRDVPRLRVSSRLFDGDTDRGADGRHER